MLMLIKQVIGNKGLQNINKNFYSHALSKEVCSRSSVKKSK